MDFENDFEKNMKQLVKLLRKIMAHQFPDVPPAKQKSYFEDSATQFNLFILNFLPLLPEDFDELEEYLGDALLEKEDWGHKEGSSDLKNQLSRSDLEFLRRHGIRF
ncbi:MAG: hypothetical protein NC930_05305 [Candidatus Omnitrophica bacterium]|nr:hypothetical protein [Candidatus Omnitrophota bacterium]